MRYLFVILLLAGCKRTTIDPETYAKLKANMDDCEKRCSGVGLKFRSYDEAFLCQCEAP